MWKPEEDLGATAENVLYWEPTGELDVPVDRAGNRAWRDSVPGEVVEDA